MPSLTLGRHTLALAFAIIFLAAAPYLAPLWYPYAPSITYFALVGTLHALAISSSLQPLPSFTRAAKFIGLTSVLSAMAPFSGILIGSWFYHNVALADFLSTAVASAIGSSAYWTLIKFSFKRGLPIRSLLITTSTCTLVSPIAFAATTSELALDYRGTHGALLELMVIPTCLWWITFSTSLYLTQREA
jgi:hypothetical protein